MREVRRVLGPGQGQWPTKGLQGPVCNGEDYPPRDGRQGRVLAKDLVSNLPLEAYPVLLVCKQSWWPSTSEGMCGPPLYCPPTPAPHSWVMLYSKPRGALEGESPAGGDNHPVPPLVASWDQAGLWLLKARRGPLGGFGVRRGPLIA